MISAPSAYASVCGSFFTDSDLGAATALVRVASVAEAAEPAREQIAFPKYDDKLEWLGLTDEGFATLRANEGRGIGGLVRDHLGLMTILRAGFDDADSVAESIGETLRHYVATKKIYLASQLRHSIVVEVGYRVFIANFESDVPQRHHDAGVWLLQAIIEKSRFGVKTGFPAVDADEIHSLVKLTILRKLMRKSEIRDGYHFEATLSIHGGNAPAMILRHRKTYGKHETPLDPIRDTDDNSRGALAFLAMPGANPESDMVRSRLIQDILKLLEPYPVYRKTFILRVIHGYEFTEIGEMLKVAPVTARTNYHKIKHKLADELGVNLDEWGRSKSPELNPGAILSGPGEDNRAFRDALRMLPFDSRRVAQDFHLKGVSVDQLSRKWKLDVAEVESRLAEAQLLLARLVQADGTARNFALSPALWKKVELTYESLENAIEMMSGAVSKVAKYRFLWLLEPVRIAERTGFSIEQVNLAITLADEELRKMLTDHGELSGYLPSSQVNEAILNPDGR